MKLIIIRHGATDYNISRIIQGHLDTPLNAQGLQQADELALALRNEKIDRVVSSDLRRARSTTAAILRGRSDVPLEYWSSLRERHYGEFQNRRVSDLLAARDHYQGRWEAFQPQGGESQLQFHERVGLAWQKLASSNPQGTVLMSVHGGVAKSLLTHALKKDLSYRAGIVQDNCCLNILHGDVQTGFHVKLINDVAHLSAPTGLEGL